MSLKKGISIVLILAVVIFSMPLVGTASTAANWEDVLEWRTINGGTEVEIIACDGDASGELVIPNEIEGLPVTSIGYRAFEDCSSLTSITIPDSVASIGEYAFYDCDSLTSVTIPDSVTSIGGGAFYGCSSLTSITIPDSVTSIGDSAFYYCRSLKSITIPDSVTSIGDAAFRDCSSLTSITIPDSVTSIGDRAFYNCSSLTSITIPDSVTSIGDAAFYNCSSLKNINIPDGVTSIGGYAFYKCSSLRRIIIPESVTSIGADAFYNCSSLTSITIPDSVTSIGESAFYGCSSLMSITIPDGVTSIGSYAFYYCRSLTNITIPNSVTSIGGHAFYYCRSLTSITIPDSVASIGSYAFSSCSSLTSITIPDSVQSIGDYAFYYCSSLTSITIPDSVTSIGDAAFYNCSSLKSATIPDGVTSIGYRAFKGCSSLTSITIPDSVTSIGDSAFSECYSLESITIPDSVTSIEYDAFYKCTSLTCVTIGNGVTSIGNSAFYGCSSLTSFNVSEGNKNYSSIDGVLFNKDKTVLISYPNGKSNTYTIPNSVTSIGADAFYNCSSLTSITIPDSVTSIGESAFYGCHNLTIYCYEDSYAHIYAVGRGLNYEFVALNSIEVKTMPTKTNYFVGDLIDTTGLTLTATYNNGVTEVISENFTYTPDELNTAGTQAVTVTYGGKTTTFNVTVKAVELTSIAIKTNPTKTNYFAGDALDTTGLTLTATHNNGTTQTISSGFTCSPTTLSTAGTQKITVTYEGKTTTFNVTVKAVELTSIAIKTNPTKTNYFVGDTLDTTGLTLTATYNNGTTQTITSGFTCSPTTLSTAGTQTITVTYEGKTATFNVKAVELSSIAIKTNPTKTSYFVGDIIDTTGLTLAASYNNGTTQTISSGFTCSPTTLSTAGTQKTTVTYGGKTTTFDVTVKAVELSSISVKTNPTKTNYFVGDTLNIAGLTLTATYNNGTTETITSGFTCSPTKLNIAGTQAVTVTYGGKTTTFNVNVTAVELSSIAVKTNPTKTSYFIGDTLDTAGLTLTATYNNGVTEVISENFTYTPDELNTAGTQAITVTYGGKTTTFDVTVKAVELSSITIKTNPTKTSYFVGDLIDTTGLTLLATYNNGVTEVISKNFTYTPDELNTAGTQAVTVTYGGKTTTFDVTVKAVELSSIAVKTNPTKTSYFIGDTLDTAGLTLTATYNNGTTETVTNGFTCSPTTLSTAGTQKITVTYQGKTTTFNVTVKAVELSSIEVKTMPTKTSYFVGDLIDTTGLTLTATYNNGVTEVISENFTYTPDELNTAGTQTITVTYGGKTTTFNVNVTAVELSSIAIKTNPTKTNYFVGDTLDTTGLTLTATYNNGTTQTITSGFTCSPTTLSTAGTQAITVTYQGKTTTFNVTVEEVPSLDVTPESNLEINKDNEFDFVLSNTDKITASSLISNFNGGNIKIYKDGKELGSDELVGTGCVVKLINDSGVEVDSLTVVIKGDVDGDGVVGVTDARTVLRVAAELENFNANAPAKLAGDVDGDGGISVTEARTILRVAVDLESF